MRWTETVPQKELKDPKGRIFKHGAKQVVILKKKKRLYVFDNRCPHEGYPLREGTVDGNCVLTCNWHNWKFDLESGKNLFGDDPLRTYPYKVKDGYVYVDFNDPPKDHIKKEYMKSLETAYEDRQYDRIARVLAKFHFQDLDLDEPIREAILWSYQRLEYGMTHCFGVTPDWLQLADEHKSDPEAKLACLTEAIDHMAYDVLRQPFFYYNRRSQPYSAEALLETIEIEDDQLASAVVNDAFTEENHYSDMLSCLIEAALSHYFDFGHALIYVKKAGMLIERLGEEIEKPIVLALVRSMVYAIREELLPEFRGYASRLKALEEAPVREEDGAGELTSPWGMSVNQALDWVVASLKTHSPLQVYGRLMEAAGKNLLHYDTRYQSAYDLPVSKNFSWLGVSHGITFGNAVRFAGLYDPCFWNKGLLQLACFTGRATPFLDKDRETGKWDVNDAPVFLKEMIPHILDHGYDQPIYAAHLVKTYMAVREELPALPPDARDAILAGLNRFLHASIKLKHVRRTIRQSIGLVGRDFVE